MASRPHESEPPRSPTTRPRIRPLDEPGRHRCRRSGAAGPDIEGWWRLLGLWWRSGQEASTSDAASQSEKAEERMRREARTGTGKPGAKGTSRRAMFTGVRTGRLAGWPVAAGGPPQTSRRPEALTTYPFRVTTRRGSPPPPRTTCSPRPSARLHRRRIQDPLSEWAVAAEQMTAGIELIGGQPSNKQLPPKDTGEGLGLQAQRPDHHLSAWAGLFVDSRKVRLAAKMPAVLREACPSPSPGGQLPRRPVRRRPASGLLNDAQVCVHAITTSPASPSGYHTAGGGQVGY